MKFKITTKFILWFLLVALVPLIIAIYISYTRSQKALETEIANSLRAVADNKANQLGNYLREKENNASTLAYLSDTIEAVEALDSAFNQTGTIDSEACRAADAEVRPFFTYYQKSMGYEDICLINPKGNVIFSVKPRNDARSLYEVALYSDLALAETFIKVKDSLTTEISDFEYSKELDKPVVIIASPVSKGPDLIGILALEMTNDGISEIVKDYKGLGDTGETIVASKIGQKAVFLAPLRFDPEAAFKRTVKIGDSAKPDIQSAVEGNEGMGRVVDYRGNEVMSVWRYIPSFSLGLAVKMDTDEILAPANRLRAELVKISLGLMALVIIMAIAIANTISGPIKELTRVSVTISGGELTARAAVRARDEIGDLAHSFNLMTDSIVEAKTKVEEKKREVEEQKHLLEKANKELDSFVYTASHDLRAPLRAISSFVTFLEEDYAGKLDEEGKGYIREIREGAGRMNRLIEDLLALSKISRIKNPFEDIDINSVIAAVAKQIEFDIQQKNVDLVVHPALPVIRCDRIKITAGFLNLINNAIKFSSKNNKERPRVEVGYMDDGEDHKFYVKDNGIGIDPKYHEQIFEIFKRLHSAEEYDGTGAGLSIVKRVVDDHSGRVWVESESGKGAAFFFTIPKEIEKAHKKLGEILIEKGLVTEKDIDDALKRQEEKRA